MRNRNPFDDSEYYRECKLHYAWNENKANKQPYGYNHFFGNDAAKQPAEAYQNSNIKC